MEIQQQNIQTEPPLPPEQKKLKQIFELKIENLPHTEAGSKFLSHLKSFHNVKSALIVHTQLPNNKKIIILRLRDKEQFQALENLTVLYNNLQVTFSSYYRSVIKQINRALKITMNITDQDEKPDFYDKICTVHLNNIPRNLKMKKIRAALEKFGEIEELRIFEKGEIKEKK